jgi:hypothetical protein
MEMLFRVLIIGKMLDDTPVLAIFSNNFEEILDNTMRSSKPILEVLGEGAR